MGPTSREDSGKYQGVILAAGHGSRMGPFGAHVPKPIAPICNKPLIGYQLETMHGLGIRDVTIVIGHLGHRISQVIGDGSAYNVRVTYVEQEKRLGLAHAVGQLEPHINRPFLLMLGDIFFEVPDLRQMIDSFERHNASAVLAVKHETDPDAVRRNFAVLLAEDGRVRRVIEKPRHVPNMLKGCGLYLFDLHIFDSIRRTPRTALRDEYELTDSIQILINDEYPVRVAAVVEWDMNLTFIGDLIACCRYQLQRLGRPFLVGENSSLTKGVELIDTVVGRGVTIGRPARLERCVVLDGAVLDDGQDYTDAVITPGAILDAAAR